MNDADMSPAAVLNRAADYIERHGWARGRFSRDGRVCAAGAIHAVLYGDPSHCEWGPEDAPMEALARAAGVASGDLAAWNDRQKSREPVLAALRAAAEATP